MVEPGPEVIGGYVVARDGFTYLGIGRTQEDALADAARRTNAAGLSLEDEGIGVILVGPHLAEAVLTDGLDLDEAMTRASRTHVPGVPLDLIDEKDEG
ncbi:hypothetical protein [Azospirillum sp. sgz302134]